MKIKKGELGINEMCSFKPEEFIEQVLQPFEYQILKNKMKISYLRKDSSNRPSLKADWRLYQLIIFNIVQNAVKYNKRGGTISITTELKEDEESQ